MYSLQRTENLFVCSFAILIFKILLHLFFSRVIVLGDINTSHQRIDHCDPSDKVSKYCHSLCFIEGCLISSINRVFCVCLG